MSLHIIMYHYVRNNEEYQYDVFSRRVDEFEQQLDFFQSCHQIVSPFDLSTINRCISGSENGFLLSFDDGYKDHLACAKILASKQLNGIFFPPALLFKDHSLDVNLIHLIIGCREHSNPVQFALNYIDIFLQSDPTHHLSFAGSHFKNTRDYICRLPSHRLNNPQMFALKCALQRDLFPVQTRRQLMLSMLDMLYGSAIEDILSDFYLSVNDMLMMKQSGMCFGSHGVSHVWLDSLPPDQQASEIELSFSKLSEVGILKSGEPKVICYPYGSFNDSTLDILKHNQVSYGLTTQVGRCLVDNLDSSYLLRLPRWDTNDWWSTYSNTPIFP